MSDKQRFTPVRGTEDSIFNDPLTKGYHDGWVYFATDTKKIYLDADGKSKIPMGASSSGIYYGTKETTDAEDEAEIIIFSVTEIEGDSLPNPDDLVLNKPDSCFYRVHKVDFENNTFEALRLAVAGGGGGGGGGSALKGPSIAEIGDLNGSQFIYGQEAYIDLTIYSETNKNGDPVDRNGLTLEWKITNKSTYETKEGNIKNLTHGQVVEFEFGTKLFPDVNNKIEFMVKGPKTTKREPSMLDDLSSVRLILKQDTSFTSLSLYDKPRHTLACLVEGLIPKVLDFYYDGSLLESRPLTEEAQSLQTYTVMDPVHGHHLVEMKLYQGLANPLTGTIEKVNPDNPVGVISMEIAVAVPGNNTPIIWLGEYQDVYMNYDKISIPYMVYTPGSVNSEVLFYKDESLINKKDVGFSSVDTKDFAIFEIVDANVPPELEKDTTANNTYRITSGKVERFIEFKVKQTGKMILAAPDFLKVKFDAAGRSNNETSVTKTSWSFANTEQFGDAAQLYTGTFEDFNWYNNGWITDPEGNSCLRISNGAKFKIDLGSTMFNSQSQGAESHTFEFQFKIRNVQNYEHLIKLVTRYKNDNNYWEQYQSVKEKYGSYEQYLQANLAPEVYDALEFHEVQSFITPDLAVCDYYDTVEEADVGFRLGTQDAFFKTNKQTLSCNYVENRIVNLSIVFQRAGNSSSGLVSIYLNGILSAVSKVAADTSSFEVKNKFIVFNSDYCDIDLYKFRVYETGLTMAQVLNNYAVDTRDVMIYTHANQLSEQSPITGELELNFNKVTDFNEKNPKDLLMPYMVLSQVEADALPYSKDDYKFPVVQFVNPSLDQAYIDGELDVLASNYPMASYPIAWISKANAATLKAKATETANNYYILLDDGSRGFILKDDFAGMSFKTKKKKDEYDVPIYRELTNVENYYIHHSPSFKAEKAETNVQGTSSQFYPRRNYKIRCKEIMYANRGPFLEDPMYLQYFYMDNDKVGTTKFTMKIDYMESSGTYNTGFANLVHGAYTKHPLQDYDFDNKPDSGYLRTNIMGFPIMMFHQKTDKTIYIGRYNMNLDKGSDENYGFKLFENHDANGNKVKNKFVLNDKNEPMDVADVAECWEFSDNNRGYCSFRDPEGRPELSFQMKSIGTEADIKAGYHTNANGTCPAVADSFEYRYHKDGDVLDYLYNPTPELKKTILEDYEGEITAENLDSFTWRNEFLQKTMSNYEKLCKWVWSTNTDMVDSNTDLYSIYATINNLGTFDPKLGQISIYDRESDTSTPALIFGLTENRDLTSDEAWRILQENYGFTEAIMKTDKFGTKDFENSTTTITKYIFTEDDIFEAYSKVTGQIYKSYFVESDTDGDPVYKGVFMTGTVKTLEEVNNELAANQDAYETDRSKKITPYSYAGNTYYFDTEEYRLAKFAKEFDLHFDREYALIYFVMTEVFMCYDSRGKNCMMASWGPHKEGGEYIWYPIFYDIDTQLGINNTGIPSFDYYVNASVDGCFSTNDSVLWGNIYRCFMDDIKSYYQKLRTTIYRKNDDDTMQPNSAPIAGIEYGGQSAVEHIENKYTCKPSSYKDMFCMKGARPLIAINLDEQYKYISIMNPAIGYQGTSAGEILVDAEGSKLYALQGDRGLSRQQFLSRRINFIDSWLNRGAYKEANGKIIKFRVSANDPEFTSDVWIDSTTNVNSFGKVIEDLIPMLKDGATEGYYQTNEDGSIKYEGNTPLKINPLDADFYINLAPYQRSYVTLATDNATLPSIEYKGEPIKVEFPANVITGVRKSPQYAEQLLYIYGADYLADVGDLSLLYPREFEAIGSTQLQRLLLGNDTEGYKNTKLKSPLFDAGASINGTGGKPLLKEVVFTNVVIEGGEQNLDFSSSEKLQIFRALGMNIATVKFADGVALHTLHLPSSVKELVLREARNLTGLIDNYVRPVKNVNTGKWEAQEGLYLQGVTDVTNPADCVNNIGKLEIIGGNMNYDSYRLLHKLYNIKETQSTVEKRGKLKISLKGINWTPYVLLEKGYPYNPADINNYYIDNEHYQLVKYSDVYKKYEENQWKADIANGLLYYKDPSIDAETYGMITDLEMLKDLANDTEKVLYENTDDVGSKIPYIEGNIYVHNTPDNIIEEGWIRNTLQQWYPNLNIFVQYVDKAYSAKFVRVNEIDGSLETIGIQKISKEDAASGDFFDNPYETYSELTHKDNYDFYGWSTRANDKNQVIISEDWDDQTFEDERFEYVYYIVYEPHPYKYFFLNSDNSNILEGMEEYKYEVDGETYYCTTVAYGNPNITSAVPGLLPSSPEEVELSDIYACHRFLGWKLKDSDKNDTFDFTTTKPIKDLYFKAVYENRDVYNSDCVLSEEYFDDPIEFGNGYALKIKDGVTLSGKITLPARVGGKQITALDSNFMTNNTKVTHVFFERGSKVTTIGESAFQGCTDLRYVELPETVTNIGGYVFYCEGSKLFADDNVTTTLQNKFFAQLTNIGAFAFSYTRIKGELVLSHKLYSLGGNAFMACPSITKVQFGSAGLASQLESCGDYIFNASSAISSCEAYITSDRQQYWTNNLEPNFKLPDDGANKVTVSYEYV